MSYIEITAIGDEYKQYVHDRRYPDKDKANELFQQDRCNYCYVNGYFYKNACKRWNVTCFPDFIAEDEMQL